MHIILGISYGRSDFNEELERIVQRCAKRLPEGIDWRLSRVVVPGGALLVWSNAVAVDRNRVADGQRGALALAGYVTSEESVSDLLGRITTRNGIPGFEESPGGIASLVHMDKESGRICAWSSRPMVCSLYFGRSGDIAAVATRPILVACTFGEPRRNRDYARSSLAAGYAMGRETPFEGVEAIESGEAALLGGGKLEIVRAPVPSVTTRGADPFQDELLRAVAVIGRLGPNEFRLSGGKDSRLLAAAAYRLGLPVHGITRGAEGWGEFRPQGWSPRRLVSNIRSSFHRGRSTFRQPSRGR